MCFSKLKGLKQWVLKKKIGAVTGYFAPRPSRRTLIDASSLSYWLFGYVGIFQISKNEKIQSLV